MKGLPKHDVSYYAPKRKRPIAYSTIATLESLAELAKNHATIEEIHKICAANVLMRDLSAVTAAYIKLGYGNLKAKEYFFVPEYKHIGKGVYKEIHGAGYFVSHVLKGE